MVLLQYRIWCDNAILHLHKWEIAKFNSFNRYTLSLLNGWGSSLFDTRNDDIDKQSVSAWWGVITCTMTWKHKACVTSVPHGNLPSTAGSCTMEPHKQKECFKDIQRNEKRHYISLSNWYTQVCIDSYVWMTKEDQGEYISASRHTS